VRFTLFNSIFIFIFNFIYTFLYDHSIHYTNLITVLLNYCYYLIISLNFQMAIVHICGTCEIIDEKSISIHR